MALYDGFFDAALNEETNEYDRAYDSGDFTGYFEQFIGSGVCVYGNPDSMRVSYQEGSAVVGPGYLFLQGYWLKNDGNYTVPLPGAGAYAIAAHLNLGLRMIELGAQAKAEPEVYPDALVLAYVTVDAAGAGVVEDTRHDVALCGAIDAAGSLSGKVGYAIDYIDNEIEGKLAQAEADIAAQAALLDAKIALVGAEVDKLAPPPIGTVKFSASRDVGAEWLPCDGRFINEVEYPELVAVLGKLTPGVEEFTQLITDSVQPGTSNAVLYKNYIWVYSINSKILYGISTTDGALKEITITTPGDFLYESSNLQICLSITGDEIFLTQKIGSTSYDGSDIYVYQSNFTVEASSIVMEDKTKFVKASIRSEPNGNSLPYVVKELDTFYMMAGQYYSGSTTKLHVFKWKPTSSTSIKTELTISNGQSTEASTHFGTSAIHAFSAKNDNKLIYFYVKHDIGFPYAQATACPGEALASSFSMPSDYNILQFGKCIPIYANGKILNKVTLESEGKIGVMYVSVSPPEPNAGTRAYTTSLSIPSMAQIFADSLDFVSSHALWICFVGTGILFSRDPSDKDGWGYLDTSECMGIIASMGGAIYDAEEQAIYLYGMSSKNDFKLFKLKLKDMFDYADNGAWLPMIASDGVPAYIKAKEPAEGA